ncbi:polysaccharide deacetylase family protein [Nitratifractor sp.]|uniref:polysaccharide deacetylase family protein n=1 Tax=Nitratifractor sp. TaxID=2268144 RepID=UPI0025D0A6FC|nr:polysaccharide deacetylase family protein [Nitratifractor sp.]
MKIEKRKRRTILFTVLFGISMIGAHPLHSMESAASKKTGKIVISMLESPFSSESTSRSLSEGVISHTFVADHPVKRSIAKELYLTFDDGPIKGTENVLNVLKEENVPATMFCIGRHARLHPELFHKELSMPDLLIANHTYTHANGHYSRFYSDTFGVLSDVEHAQIILGGRKYLRLAGRNVWRLPEVSRNDQAIVLRRGFREVPNYEALSHEGYFIYGWDVEWHFEHRRGHPVESPELLASRIEALYRHGRMASRGKVVLLAHDFMFRSRRSTEELRHFIRLMKRRGWHFKTLRHYSRLTPQPLYVAKYYGKQRSFIASNSRNKNISTVRKAQVSMGNTAEKSLTHASSIHISRSREALLSDAIRHYDALDVDRLIRQGASVNRIDEFGRTPLNTAVRANSLFLVKKLLAHGADLTQKDRSGITPLQTAKRFKRQAIETYLLHCTRKYSGSLRSARGRGVGNPPIAIAQPIRMNPLKVLGSANISNPFN